MSQKNVEIAVDHNFHLQTLDVMEKWEERRSPEYKDYRLQWYTNPKNNIVNNYPIHLDIEATSACNFLCTMCPRTEMIENKKFWKVENFDLETYKMIISDGYNGTPTGFENICEDDENYTKWYVLHAEANAIMKVSASTQSSEGATLYITLSPCRECSKLIFQSGIKRVVYHKEYKDTSGLEFLKKGGIEICHIKTL